MKRPPWIVPVAYMADMVALGRGMLLAEAARCEAEAQALDREIGGETVVSAVLRFRAAWLLLGAALLGDRG